MNSSDTDLFQRMCTEATNELAKGGKSWKEIDTNTLFLACFGMLSNHLTHKIANPLWFAASSICAAVIGYLVKTFLGG